MFFHVALYLVFVYKLKFQLFHRLLYGMRFNYREYSQIKGNQYVARAFQHNSIESINI